MSLVEVQRGATERPLTKESRLDYREAVELYRDGIKVTQERAMKLLMDSPCYWRGKCVGRVVSTEYDPSERTEDGGANIHIRTDAGRTSEENQQWFGDCFIMDGFLLSSCLSSDWLVDVRDKLHPCSECKYDCKNEVGCDLFEEAE